MSYAEIGQALVEQWKSVVDSTLTDTLTVAYPNAHFEPPKDSPWAKVFLLAAPSNVGSIGSTGDDEFSGIFQIDLFYPLGEGEFRTNRTIDEIRGVFKAGTYLTYSGGTQWVIIMSCSPLDSIEEDGWYRTVISIEWETRLTRV